MHSVMNSRLNQRSLSMLSKPPSAVSMLAHVKMTTKSVWCWRSCVTPSVLNTEEKKGCSLTSPAFGHRIPHICLEAIDQPSGAQTVG